MRWSGVDNMEWRGGVMRNGWSGVRSSGVDNMEWGVMDWSSV